MVVTEADFTIDFPEITKDVESTPVKRKLIEPVAATNETSKRKPKRYSGEKLAQSVTNCHQLPVALPVAVFISLEKKLTRAIFDFLHYIGRWW